MSTVISSHQYLSPVHGKVCCHIWGGRSGHIWGGRSGHIWGEGEVVTFGGREKWSHLRGGRSGHIWGGRNCHNMMLHMLTESQCCVFFLKPLMNF